MEDNKMNEGSELGNKKSCGLPEGWKIFNKYQIRHTDGTPLKGKAYFVLRLDSDNPDEAARVDAAMKAYTGIQSEYKNGNALHDALVQIEKMVNALDEECCVDPVEVRDLARKALKAPVRNCDKFNDCRTAKDFFVKNELWKYNQDLSPEYWFGVWLMQKEGGEE